MYKQYFIALVKMFLLQPGTTYVYFEKDEEMYYIASV